MWFFYQNTVTEMQNENKTTVHEFTSKCDVEQSLVFIYIHIIFY